MKYSKSLKNKHILVCELGKCYLMTNEDPVIHLFFIVKATYRYLECI